MSKTMKAARVVTPSKMQNHAHSNLLLDGDFEITQVPIPTAGKGQVRIKVVACGVCHSDVIPKTGGLGTQLPRIPYVFFANYWLIFE